MSGSGRPPVKAILFDLDGTLVDSVPDLAGAVNFALRRLGRPEKSPAEVAAHVGNGVRVLLEKTVGDGQILSEEFFARAQALFEEHYRAHCLDATVAYPGVAQTLAELSEVPKAVVTNKPREFTDKILGGLDLLGRFDVVLGGDSLPLRKPRPEPFWEASRRLGAEPETTLVVGDSPIDIRAGKAAGMRVWVVTYGLTGRETLESEKPDRLIDRFEEIREIKNDAHA